MNSQNFASMSNDEFWKVIKQNIDNEFKGKPDYSISLFKFWNENCKFSDLLKYIVSIHKKLQQEQTKEQIKSDVAIKNNQLSYAGKMADEVEGLICKDIIYSTDLKALSLHRF